MHALCRWLMPFTMVVVRIQAVTWYSWLYHGDFGPNQGMPGRLYGELVGSQGHRGTPTSQNPSHVSLNDGWGPLRQWIDVLTAPRTHMLVQAGPTGSSSLGALRRGLGCYG